MTSPPIQIVPKPARLTAAELAALRRAVERERAAFAHRLAGPLEVIEFVQPFFARHRVLQINSPLPFPAVGIHVAAGPDGELCVLTGHLENLEALAVAAPPSQLGDAEAARVYANVGDSWTRDAEFGELLVQSVGEIPWRSNASAEERARAAAVVAELGASITPMTLHSEDGGFALTKWVLSNRRLIARRLLVPRDGRLQRTDDVRATDLPVFPGRTWGMVNGRLVPTG